MKSFMFKAFIASLLLMLLVSVGFSAPITVDTSAITFDTAGLTTLFVAVMGILGLIFLFRKIIRFINGS